MSEKRLYQVNWAKGQTDGDQVEGTVRRILNMNIDGVGRAESRKGVVPSGQTSDGYSQSAYMAYNPPWATNSIAWIAMLSDTSVKMTPVLPSGSVSTSSNVYALPIDGVSAANSKMVAYSDRIFIAAVDSSGNALGVIMVSSTSQSTRFRPPKYLIGTAYEYTQASTPEGWVVTLVGRDAPKLHVKSVKGFDFVDDSFDGNEMVNYPGSSKAGVFHWPTGKLNIASRYDDARTALLEEMSADGNESIGLLVAMVCPDDDIDNVHGDPKVPYLISDPRYDDVPSEESGPLGIYGRKAAVEFKVQYVFYGGQTSALSNPVAVSGMGVGFDMLESLEIYKYSFGVSLVVNTSIDSSVMAINVYRKIIDSGSPDVSPDTDYMLIATAMLDSDDLEKLDVDMGTMSIDKYIVGSQSGWRWDATHLSTTPHKYNKFYPTTGWRFANASYGSSADSVPAFCPSSRKRHIGCTSSSQSHKTSGWVKINSSYATFMPEHFGGMATVVYTCDTARPPDDGTVNTTCPKFSVTLEDVLMASRKFGVGAEVGTVIRSGADFPLCTGKYTLWPGGPANQHGFVVFGTPRANTLTSIVDRGGGFVTDFMALYEVTDSPTFTMTNSTPNPPTLAVEGYTSRRIPFIGFRDTGEVPPDSEYSMNGGVAADFVTVKPTSISVTGGRLIGVGGAYDEKSFPSRLWYSMFQNFGMVLEGNYLDYGSRDDGAAIDISTYQGKMLIHFSSATYIVDISGGSDMAWRELGANTGIGILNNHCVAETPIGNVWCDANGVYLFNGRGVTEISHMPEMGVTIRDTYLDIISGSYDKVHVCFRKDLKQVWICVQAEVLVWDTQSGAWHEHYLGEVIDYGGGTFDVLGFFDINGESVMALRFGTTNPYIVLGHESTAKEAMRFSWGMDVDFDALAPEIVKKAKRFYADIMTKETNKHITVSVNGQGGAPITQDLSVAQVSDLWRPDADTMVRFSASARGRSIFVSIRSKRSETWYGVIESLGMSHKFKALK